MIKKLSIIVPAFNEENTIIQVLERIIEISLIQKIEKEIIVVNDCSTDNTEDVVKDFIDQYPSTEIHYFNHKKNKGKGAALHTGIENATGDYIIIQDADLEYDPQEINSLLEPLSVSYIGQIQEDYHCTL